MRELHFKKGGEPRKEQERTETAAERRSRRARRISDGYEVINRQGGWGGNWVTRIIMSEEKNSRATMRGSKHSRTRRPTLFSLETDNGKMP